MCERERKFSFYSANFSYTAQYNQLWLPYYTLNLQTFYSSYYWKFVPFYNISWFPQPPSLWQPLFSSVSLIYLLFICIFFVVLVQSLSHVQFLTQPHGLQHTMLFCLPLSPGVCSDSCQFSQWCYLSVSSSTVLFSTFAFSLSQHQGLFHWISSSHQVLELQHQSFQSLFKIDFL